MKIRKMKSSDLPAVASVYNSRAAISVGLLQRNMRNWKMRRKRKFSRGLWVVAEYYGKVIGYGVGRYDDGYGGIDEIFWHPDYDGTPVGSKIMNRLFQMLRRKKPILINIWEMAGSTMHTLDIPDDLSLIDNPGVFMAAVTDSSLLLRDAKRIIERRIKDGMRLSISRKSTLINKRKKAEVKVTMKSNVLLGLLLGLRKLNNDIRYGRVKYAPKTKKALSMLESAFPTKTFWIEDAW